MRDKWNLLIMNRLTFYTTCPPRKQQQQNDQNLAKIQLTNYSQSFFMLRQFSLRENSGCWGTWRRGIVGDILEKDSEFTIFCLLTGYWDFYCAYSSCARKLSFSPCHIKMAMRKLKSISLACSVWPLRKHTDDVGCVLRDRWVFLGQMSYKNF